MSKKDQWYVITGRGVCGPYTYEQAKRIRDYRLALESPGSLTEGNTMISAGAATERQKAAAHRPKL